jgi:hypothetical protein
MYLINILMITLDNRNSGLILIIIIKFLEVLKTTINQVICKEICIRQAYNYFLLLRLLFISEQKMAQRIEMHICLGSSCFSRGNKDVVNFIREYLRKNHIEDKVIFKGARCMGLCSNGPNLNINGSTIEGVTISKIEGILEKELGRLL